MLFHGNTIKLDFQFDWRHEKRRSDYRTISLAELYDCGKGDLRFAVAGCDFGTRWGWVSAIQCALHLMELTDDLACSKGVQVFEFMEITDVIRFERLLRSVRVTASYAPGEAIVPLWDLVIAIRKFSKRVVRVASRDRNGLLENPYISKLMSAPTAPARWSDVIPGELVN